MKAAHLDLKDDPMPGRKPTIPPVEPRHKISLEALIRRYTTPQQLVLRAKIVLLANQGLNNQEIARQLGVSACMARQWRGRWISLQQRATKVLTEQRELSEEQKSEQEIEKSEQEIEKIVRERLADAPRPGAPAKISPEQYCQIMALACQRPEELGRPITQWSSRELVDEAIDKGIVQTISPRQMGRFLKRSGC
jgi:putative transposase